MSSEKFKPAYLHPKYWLSWLMVGFTWLLAQIPRPWQSGISDWVARRLVNSRNSRIRTIRRNIDLCFIEKSEAEREKLVVANLSSSMLMLFDLVNMVWQPATTHTEQVNVIGEDYLAQALSKNKPLLLVSGHFTPLFQACMKLALLRSYNAIYRRLDNPILESQLYQRGIQKYPITVIHRKDIRDMLAALAGGGTTLIVPDQDFGVKRGGFIPFFGIPTATISTIPQYASQTDANVLLFSCYREGDACVLKFEPVLDNYPSGDDMADTRLWSDWLEVKIREHPADYLWMHKRFKTRPEGEPSLYR
jgi:KDO2-lipid IV(A) lauroyltransferase